MRSSDLGPNLTAGPLSITDAAGCANEVTFGDHRREIASYLCLDADLWRFSERCPPNGIERLLLGIMVSNS